MLWQRTTTLIKIKCTNSNIPSWIMKKKWREGRRTSLSRLLTVSIVVRGPCLLFLPHAFVIPILPATWTPTHLLDALRFRRLVRCGYLGVRVTRVPIAWKRSWSLARKVILGIRVRKCSAVSIRETTRGEIGPISRDSAHRIIPDRKFDRVFHVDEHIAHIFNYPISTVLFDRVK